MIHRWLLPLMLVSAWLCSASAQNPSRPCGPELMQGPLRLLVPQGVAGADFRPACRRHDACYGRLGASKDRCDHRFLLDMQRACRTARHPRWCRFVASTMHHVTTRSGGDAFARSQLLAWRQWARAIIGR